MISQQHIDQFHREGYFTTGVVFDAETLNNLRAEFDRMWQEEIRLAEQNDPENAEFVRLRPFLGHVHAKSKVCADFVRLPPFQEICRTFIGPDADLYYNQAVLKPPGKGKAFGWHQDSQYVITEPLEYVTCWVAVADATIENGTIWLVPRMHQQGLLPHIMSEEQKEWQLQFDDSGKIAVELKAGQMAVFSSMTPHCSGPNTSSQTRYAYVPQYHHVGVRKVDDGELFGDQFPVIRNGQAVTNEPRA